VNVGEFSRKGESRGAKAQQALDHDMNPEKKMVPFGILDVLAGLATIILQNSQTDAKMDEAENGIVVNNPHLMGFLGKPGATWKTSAASCSTTCQLMC
jgi:hypothetical protein